MKIRYSYVSNSSSSSCIIFGKGLGNLIDVPFEDFDFDNKMYFVIGAELPDGMHLVELNEEYYDFFMSLKDIKGRRFPVIEAYSYEKTDDDFTQEAEIPEGLPEGTEVFIITYDFDGPENIEDAEWYYENF